MNEIIRAIEVTQMKDAIESLDKGEKAQESLKKGEKTPANLKKEDMDGFSIGDTVKVHFKIVEGTDAKTGQAKERIQVYEGLVIAMKNAGIAKTFTVRKNSYGVGVERIFPVHSPRVTRIEVTRRGKVRRAKLYYIRGKIGKAAKIKELIVRKRDRKAAVAAAPVAAKPEAAGAEA